MHYLGSLLNILDTKMEVPVPYGWFHILFFVASILIGVTLCKRHPTASEQFIRWLLLGASLLVISLELYKQINFSLHYDGESINLHRAINFSVRRTQMHTEIIVGIFFPDRLNTFVFKGDAVTNINFQNLIYRSNNFIFFHLDATNGCVHIHRRALESDRRYPW